MSWKLQATRSSMTWIGLNLLAVRASYFLRSSLNPYAGPAPANLHLPQFTYSALKPTEAPTVAESHKRNTKTRLLSHKDLRSLHFFSRHHLCLRVCRLCVLVQDTNLILLSTSWKETSGSASIFLGSRSRHVSWRCHLYTSSEGWWWDYGS